MNIGRARLLILLMLSVGAPVARAYDIPGFTPDQIIPYKQTTNSTGGAVSLNLDVFTPPGHQATDSRPAIVFFFGGGWVDGSTSHFHPQCEYLASRGMVAISAEYRVKNIHGTTPQECVKDGKSAIRYVREHAAALGIDPNRIAAGGGSAGGHVAAATAILAAYDEPTENLAISSKPNALVIYNGVVDNGPGGYGYSTVQAYWQTISPLYNLLNTPVVPPPTVFFLGTLDQYIPVATGQAYQAATEAKGARCDLHLYEGQPHSFFNYDVLTDTSGPFYGYRDTLFKTDEFLVSLGYLSDPHDAPAAATGWVTISGDAGFSGGSAATASPITTDADADAIAANFAPVTLADGDFIRLTGSVTFNASLTATNFRIGLFDGDNPVTTGDGTGYVGIWASAPSTTATTIASGNGTGTSNPFESTASTTLGPIPAATTTVPANTPVAFTLMIARNGGSLEIHARFNDGTTYIPSQNLLNVAVADFTYDRVALLMTGNLNATQGSFTNIGITRGRVLPDPVSGTPPAPIANWQVMFAASPLTVGGVPASGLATDSPIFGTPSGTSNPMDGIGVAGRFGTTTTPVLVTLEVGQTLTVSASVTFNGGVTTGGSAYRFAVLNDAAKFNVPSADNWGGGWLHVVNTNLSGELFQARTDGNYMSTATNAVDLNATKAYSGGALSANSATPYLWTMTITRDSETTVDLVSSFVGGPNNYSETYTKNDIATGLFTYNAVGVQATTAGDLDQLSVSNAQYSVTGNNPDTDGDGLPDSYEQTIIDANPGDAINGLEDVMGTGASPAVTDFDNDGASDAQEYTNGTNPLDSDSDDDGLLDGVEDNTGTFVDAGHTGTDPLDPDSDDDLFNDGIEVANGTNPNIPSGSLGPRVLGIDFNRDDVFGSPSQSLFRVVSGSATQAANDSSYAKTFGGKQLTISQPGAVKFEFRGANGDTTRAIPGGDTSLSYLVSDFIATRSGAIDLTITGLAAGTYLFRSYHLDTFTGSGFGFAQGTTTTTPNTIQVKIGGAVKASVQPTALGTNGLNTTFINNNQIPTLSFGFTHAGAGPLTIELRATQSNGSDSHLLLNGFELFQANP